ncbi:MAG: DHA2 family efflux MFS transporter permease subunit [Acidimicrobiales bacterium]|nr:DHA2 family efflux MFS transporter permease subunit [Acidimicrobiales bacterium]HJO80633.1 DHA2 family efflux MFS transporter permease subunit [Acidimicrobiales bacterium]
MEQREIVQADRRAWMALTVSTLAALLTVIDISIVNVAFPSIRQDLGATEAGLSWILSGYSVAVGAFLLLAGRIADKEGRRRLFMVGVAVFLVGSLASGLAPSTSWLIASRVVQGIGGSILSPASLSMVLPEFPHERHSTVIGVWGASAALGAAVGPSFGAVLIDTLSWRWVFLVNVPIGLFILVLTPHFVRESRDSEATGRFDLLSVPAGTLGVACILLAVVQGGDWGYRSGPTVLIAAVGLVFIGVLVVRSMTHQHPLLDLGLFRFRSFWSAATGQVFFGTAFIAIVLFNTLLLQELWAWSALAAGFGVVPGPALAAILGGPVGSVANRIGHRNLLVVGSLSTAASPLLLLMRVGTDSNYLGTLLPASLFLGVGVACSFATFASLGLKEVPASRYATASATLRTTSQVGFASGVAIAIAVFQTGTDQGILVAFERAWMFMTVTLIAGALFCAFACPSREQIRGLVVH